MLRMANGRGKECLVIERTVSGLCSLTHIPLSLSSPEAMLFGVKKFDRFAQLF